MAALRGEETCFIHSPKTRAARSAARSRGGAANRQPAEPSTPAVLNPAPAFNLGPLDSKTDIARALLGLGKSVARGEIDARRGRLIAEALRSSLLALDSVSSAIGDAPLGGRELTDDELAWMRAHPGRMPPGIETVGDGRWWVSGAEYELSPQDRQELKEHAEEERAIAAFLKQYRMERAYSV